MLMEVLEYGKKNAETVLLQMVDDNDLKTMEQEVALIRENAGEDFRLLACRVRDWNLCLSPWKAPAVFGRQDFGGGAEDTLRELLDICPENAKICYIGGYSLAGLFALWAAYQADRFRGVAAASPSMWFPGFTEYMRAHELRCGNIYLSLGDKEEKARNPVMATVGDRIREADLLLREQGKNCILEWNQGNHFQDAGVRTAKAFSWVMRQEVR